MSTNHFGSIPAEKSIPQTRESIQSILKDLQIINDRDAAPCFEYIVIGEHS